MLFSPVVQPEQVLEIELIFYFIFKWGGGQVFILYKVQYPLLSPLSLFSSVVAVKVPACCVNQHGEVFLCLQNKVSITPTQLLKVNTTPTQLPLVLHCNLQTTDWTHTIILNSITSGFSETQTAHQARGEILES